MSETYRKFEHKNHTFIVHEPKNCNILVQSEKLPDGNISVHEATGMFRESVNGWGTDCDSLDSALSRVCNRMIARAKQKNRDTMCKEMDDFYVKLEDV